MSRSALAVGVAAVVASVLALCVPGTARAIAGPHRYDVHYVYTCVTVRDRARHDTGKICISAFINPRDLEWHFRANASFLSISGGRLSKVSAAALYLKLGRDKHGYRRNPRTSARHGTTALRMVTAWIADPRQQNPTAVVENACMAWRNGGRACRHGYLSGGIPGYVSTIVWRAKTAPVAGLVPAPGVTLGTGVYPSVVSCPAAGSCVAVGSYWDSADNIHGLIETLSDGSWSASKAPTAGLNPAPSADPGGLQALSCPAAGWCVAVGSYQDQAGSRDGLIETLTNRSWTAQTAPVITGASHVQLLAVSCPARGSCVAVGDYEDTAGNLQGLTEVLAGGTWTAATLPSAGLSPAPGPYIILDAVSCPAAGSCVAAGWYQDAAHDRRGVIATLSSGIWTALTAPEAGLNPAAAPNPLTLLRGVSCPEPGMCAVVGNYVSTSGQEVGLSETLTGGTWVPAAVARPFSGLTTVDCPAPGSCVAFGGPFVVTLSDGSWQTRMLPTSGLKPAGGVLSVSAVSCPAAGSCAAFGMYTDASGLEHGFTARLVHGAWTAMTAPTVGLRPPPNFSANPLQPPYEQPITTGGIACPTSRSCVAVGFYQDSANASHGLIAFQQNVTTPLSRPGG